MSAKDPRKAIALRLDPALHQALIAFARANNDVSLAAAARRALRAALGLASARPAPPSARQIPLKKPPRPLRLQLEPELRALLQKRNAGPLEKIIRDLLQSALNEKDLGT